MRRSWLLLAAPIPLLLAACAGNCSSADDCGPVDLPPLPVLVSPSPLPDSYGQVTFFTPTPTPTLTPSSTPPPSPTPTATRTAIWDNDAISDQLATIQAVAESTDVPVLDDDGNPMDSDSLAAEIASNSGTFFGYLKGLQAASFGNASPLFTFMISAFFMVLTVKVLTLGLPVVMVGIGFIRRLVQIIFDFIPF